MIYYMLIFTILYLVKIQLLEYLNRLRLHNERRKERLHNIIGTNHHLSLPRTTAMNFIPHSSQGL
jgi:hypothetical protein